MTHQLESERKFLVNFPSSWSELAEMLHNLVDVKRISQVYLKAQKGKQAGRIRKTVQGLSGDTEVVYHYNEKKPVETGVHQEKEVEISKEEYQQALKSADPDRVEISKIRFVFKYHNQTFELDVFNGALKGLAILELELEDIDDKIKLPPFLPVKKEITGDQKYSNYNLADKKYHASKD